MQDTQDKSAFDSAIRALEFEIANAGTHLTIDAAARQSYAMQIQAMANELRGQVASGRMTWAQAAQQAQEARNAIMEVIRGRSTPVGRAMAERLKREGKTLNELIARKTQQLHGVSADFNRLSATQKNAVYAEIVKSAGTSNHPGDGHHAQPFARGARSAGGVHRYLGVLRRQCRRQGQCCAPRTGSDGRRHWRWYCRRCGGGPGMWPGSASVCHCGSFCRRRFGCVWRGLLLVVGGFSNADRVSRRPLGATRPYTR